VIVKKISFVNYAPTISDLFLNSSGLSKLSAYNYEIKHNKIGIEDFSFTLPEYAFFD
jgi:hypothetical protein